MEGERGVSRRTRRVLDFMDSGPDQGVIVYPLFGSLRKSGIIVNEFCMAAMPTEESLSKIEFIVYGNGDRKNYPYFRKIFEMDFSTEEENAWSSGSIDGAVEGVKKASLEQTPVFTISFGNYKDTGERADFIHAINGFSPSLVFSTIRRYAEISLFGGELPIE